MVEQIVAALLGGVAASTGKVASKAVEDAYGILKSLLIRKLGEKADVVDAVAKLEANPESEGRRALVAEEMAAAKVADDPVILDAAQRLQGVLDQLPAKDCAQIQQAVGNYISQARESSTAVVKVVYQNVVPRT